MPGSAGLRSEKKGSGNTLFDLAASSMKTKEALVISGAAGGGTSQQTTLENMNTVRRAKHTRIHDLAQVGRIVLTSARGGASQLTVHNDNLVSTGPGMRPSIAPRGVLLERNSGSWYFEVLVVTPGNAYVGIGDAFYTGNSRDAQGIGDDAHSWGYSGYLCKRKHDKVTQPFGFAWKTETWWGA